MRKTKANDLCDSIDGLPLDCGKVPKIKEGDSDHQRAVGCDGQPGEAESLTGRLISFVPRVARTDTSAYTECLVLLPLYTYLSK